MRELYVGIGSVSGETGDNIIAAYKWMNLCFYQKHGQPEQILFPESDIDFFSAVPPRDANLQAIWIERRFRAVKDWCNMGKWPIAFEIEPQKLITRQKGRTQQNRLSEVHSSRMDEKYYVDDYGQPVFYYKSDKANEAGYINNRIIKKLADMLHKTEPKPLFIQKMANHDLCIIGGAFMGFGHLFCAANRGRKTLLNPHSKENIAAFALAIYFYLHGMNNSQAIKSFGHLMSATTKQDLKVAFRQLRFFRKKLDVLRTELQEIKANLAA